MGSKNTIWFYATAAGALIIDQLTKFVARAQLIPNKPVTLIPGFLDFRLAYNDGAAFSVGRGLAPLLVLIGLVAVFAIVRLRRVRNASLSLSIGLGLLLGGAIGNLVDRLTSSLGVTDFIDLSVKIYGYQWPTFNFADMAIVVGAIIVLFRVYVIEKRQTDEDVCDDQHEGQTDG